MLTVLRRVWITDKQQLIMEGREDWKPAVIKEVLEDGAAIVETEDGEETEVAAAEMVDREEVIEIDSSNLAEMPSLTTLSDPAIMSILMQRYEDDLPFTFVASVLLYIPKAMPNNRPSSEASLPHEAACQHIPVCASLLDTYRPPVL